MSLKKRIVAVIISIIAAISVMMGGIFCSADEVDFGTYEDGIYKIGQMYWVHLYPSYKGGEGIPNGDFEQGFKYWAQGTGKKCSDVATIKKEENGNTYLHFNGEQVTSNYEGITSLRFMVKGVKEGSPVTVLYKWRGDNMFQIYLEQWDMSPDEKRYTNKRISSSMYTKAIYQAVDETEWNIGVTSVNDGMTGVEPLKNGYGEYFFILGIQTTTDITATFDIDDVQLVYRQSDGIIKSMSGQELYDLNNLDIKVIEETDFDFSDFDVDSKKVEMPGPSGMKLYDKAVISESNNPIKDIAGSIINPASPWFWVVISAGVIIIVAAVVIIIMLIKKKKSADADEVAEEATEEVAAEENADVSDEVSDDAE